MLEFQNVSAGYGAQDVLHDLTFTLQSGANQFTNVGALT